MDALTHQVEAIFTGSITDFDTIELIIREAAKRSLTVHGAESIGFVVGHSLGDRAFELPLPYQQSNLKDAYRIGVALGQPDDDEGGLQMFLDKPTVAANDSSDAETLVAS